MANGQAAQVTDDEWEYTPAKKKQDDDEWEYKPAAAPKTPVPAENLPGSTPLLRQKAAGLGQSLIEPTQFERRNSPQPLTGYQQEADYARAYSSQPGITLTDADVATLGLGGMGVGKSVARQGLKATAKAVAKSALGAAGGSFAGSHGGRALGSIVGHPEEGAQIGATVGGLAGGLFGGIGHEPELFDKPGSVGAPLPSAEEFYAKRGAELNSMRRLQPGAFAKETPFDVPTEGRSVGAPLPEAGEFYENRGKDLMARARAQDALDRAAAKEAESVGSKIVAPSVGVSGPHMTGNEGRAATWTNEAVMRLAAQGNREAIQQAIRRGMELPPGARYVMGDPDFGRAAYNPKEVTRFTPEGTPIRNVENPTEPAPRARVAAPAPQPAAREVINASTGEVTHPQEAIGPSIGTPPAEPVGLKRGLMTERRSSVRDIQGPDLMRTARAQQLREQLLDSSLSARDRAIIQAQLDDLKANPFERHEGGDINSMKAKKTLSREEAEANTAKRKEGRNKRFSRANQ